MDAVILALVSAVFFALNAVTVRKALVRHPYRLNGVILFVVPLCVFFLVESYDYVLRSWQIREISRDAGGLPYPFVPLLKSALLIMPVAVLLQGISMALHSVRCLKGD